MVRFLERRKCSCDFCPPVGFEYFVVGNIFRFEIARPGLFRNFNALVRNIIYNYKFLPDIQIREFLAFTLYPLGYLRRSFKPRRVVAK